MHSSRGVLGRLRTHREIYLVECTYWYKEEFSLWISFLIDHCPDFEIGLQKCMTPQVASWGESRHLFTIHNYSDYHLVFFFIYSDFEKKQKLHSLIVVGLNKSDIFACSRQYILHLRHLLSEVIEVDFKPVFTTREYKFRHHTS